MFGRYNIATDGRLRKYMGWTDWSNRFLVRHLILGPVLLFAGGCIIIGLSLISGMYGLMFLSILLFLPGLLLLIYALLRKVVVFRSTEYQHSISEPSRELLEAKKKARRQAIASWRRRARQDRHRRRNPNR